MSAVTVGKTRRDLEKLFQQQAGFGPLGSGTFLSRACMYFMVDVEFQLKAPHATGPDDVITKMSRPYLNKTGLLMD